MALEQLTLSSDAKVPVDGGGGGGADEGSKVPRLPRWTRQEILVLIQGKRVAENRVRRGGGTSRVVAGLGGLGQVEPKWASVSSYCKRHGVNRGPVQCRKRWSNLAGDFKKIKEWESQARDESDSFWVMRNDLRRERKLPGFFDKEVYDILEGASLPEETEAPRLALALAPAVADDADYHDHDREERVAKTAAVAGDVVTEVVFDSGRSAVADDGMFSDFEQSGHETPQQQPTLEEVVAAKCAAAPMPISEKQYQAFTSGGRVTDQGNEKQPSTNAEFGSTSQDGRKRKRLSSEGDAEAANLQDQLIQVLERNGRVLDSHLEAQNTMLKLDREERKDHASSLVAVLDKLADALGRIADKL